MELEQISIQELHKLQTTLPRPPQSLQLQTACNYTLAKLSLPIIKQRGSLLLDKCHNFTKTTGEIKKVQQSRVAYQVSKTRNMYHLSQEEVSHPVPCICKGCMHTTMAKTDCKIALQRTLLSYSTGLCYPLCHATNQGTNDQQLT